MNKKTLSAEEVARLKADGAAKRQARKEKRNQSQETQQAPETTPAPIGSLEEVTLGIIERLDKTKDVLMVIASKNTFSKRYFLDLLYHLIDQKNGRIKDGGVKKIMNLFSVADYSDPHLRKRYLKCISAAYRQRQVFIKDEIAKFIIQLFKAGYVEWSILITMLEGEYISRKTHDILNDDEIAQILVQAGMGGMITAKLSSIVENGGNVCVWTQEFTPATEVKLEMLKKLLEKYQTLQK